MNAPPPAPLASGSGTEVAAPLASMHPACFALVMATGIISIAADALSWRMISRGLFGANVLFYGVLWVLLGVRLARYPRHVVGDLAHHGRSVGFFTTVAATCVLGTQFLIIAHMPVVALGLWCWGIGLWILLTYGIFTMLTVTSTKPTLDAGINGGWLVIVVATQSVSVLGSQLSAGFGEYQPQALMLSLSMWLGGGMIYMWVIALIFYRYMFFSLSPSDLSPPYWINMGAMAISTLAGTMLIAAAPRWALLTELAPFLKGVTLFCWSTATGWIPMLLILGFWRHVLRRFPLRYDPLYWGAVFPLGMYAACTLRLIDVMEIPFLAPLPVFFFWIAVAAWSAVFVGLLRTLWRMMARE